MCSVDGCVALNHARGYCAKHYARFKRNGAPNVIRALKGDSVSERLKRYSVVNGETGCIEWIGALSSKDKFGYGTLTIHGKKHRAHRLAWEINFGGIPKGMFVCHKCDNPKCINPEHLFIGANKDNCDDRDKKGRNVVKKGIENSNSKLTERQVVYIRKLYSIGLSQQNIATLFFVSKPTIQKITSNTYWRHIQ